VEVVSLRRWRLSRRSQVPRQSLGTSQSCAGPWLDPTRIRALLATPPRLCLQLE